MGFKRPGKTYLLQFEGELEGLEVRAKGANVQQIMEIVELARFASGEKFSISDVKELDNLFVLFADRLISWNLEDENGPVILDSKVAALKSQDLDFVMSLIFAWLDAVVGTSAPLDEKSSDGEPLEEGLIPMEVSSGSPQDLPMQSESLIS